MNNTLIAQTLGLPSALDDASTGGRNGSAVALKRAVIYLRVSTPRQARKNGEAEGYSLPAQRAACTRKAVDLGGTVVEEFIDAGETARTSDRDGLQELLRYVAANSVDYVVVHKLDRLARNRADDIAIVMAIKNAGATLVSVMENIDDTPAGILQHGMMASFNEYYSANLALEAKKGMQQKALNGGTHGVAPIGYLNTVTRMNGIDVKGVAVDPERAEHVTWAFRTYSAGNVSIATLTDLLAERGLKSRTTRKYVSKAISEAQVHRLLKNPYYLGKIIYHGVVYDGAHQPLIDDETWFQVQNILAGRRIAGDRSWKNLIPTKGVLVCNRCGSRVSYGKSRGEGGTYEYFFCLGRHAKRTGKCSLPYIPADAVEQAVLEQWKQLTFTPEQIADTRAHAFDVLEIQHQDSRFLADGQRQRLHQLEIKKKRLMDAFLEGVFPAEEVKPRQASLDAEIQDATRLIRLSEEDISTAKRHVETLLALLTKPAELYRTVSNASKQLLNNAVFTALRLDIEDENYPIDCASNQVTAELAAPVAAIVELAHEASLATNAHHTPTRGRTGVKAALRSTEPSTAGHNRTPGALSLAGGSNVSQLAERTGFEPAIVLLLYTLSKRAPSTTRPSLLSLIISVGKKYDTLMVAGSKLWHL